MFRFLRIAVGIAIVAGLVMLPFLLSGTEAASTNVSVIVELRDDPDLQPAAAIGDGALDWSVKKRSSRC